MRMMLNPRRLFHRRLKAGQPLYVPDTRPASATTIAELTALFLGNDLPETPEDRPQSAAERMPDARQAISDPHGQ